MKWSIREHLIRMVNAAHILAVVHIAIWFLLVWFSACSYSSHYRKVFGREHVDIAFVLPPDTQKLSFSLVVHLTLSEVSSSEIFWHTKTISSYGTDRVGVVSKEV